MYVFHHPPPPSHPFLPSLIDGVVEVDVLLHHVAVDGRRESHAAGQTLALPDLAADGVTVGPDEVVVQRTGRPGHRLLVVVVMLVMLLPPPEVSPGTVDAQLPRRRQRLVEAGRGKGRGSGMGDEPGEGDRGGGLEDGG